MTLPTYNESPRSMASILRKNKLRIAAGICFAALFSCVIYLLDQQARTLRSQNWLPAKAQGTAAKLSKVPIASMSENFVKAMLSEHPSPRPNRIVDLTALGIDQAYVINLAFRPDRLISARALWTYLGMDVKIMDASSKLDHHIDIMTKAALQRWKDEGSDIAMIENASHLGGPLNFGEVGCYHSHLKIYRDIVKRNHAYGLIFEDDADVGMDFATQLKRVMEQVKREKADITLVGHCFGGRDRSKPVSKEELLDPTLGTYESEICLHGYLVSNKAARFLSASLPYLPSNAIDEALRMLMAKQRNMDKPDLKVFTVLPSIVEQQPEAVSDLRPEVHPGQTKEPESSVLKHLGFL